MVSIEIIFEFIKRIFFGGNWGEGDLPPLELLVSALRPLNRNSKFFGCGAFPPFLCAHCLERTCAMNIFFPWNLNILYIIKDVILFTIYH